MLGVARLNVAEPLFGAFVGNKEFEWDANREGAATTDIK
jgi:hypothetical protein